MNGYGNNLREILLLLPDDYMYRIGSTRGGSYFFIGTKEELDALAPVISDKYKRKWTETLKAHRADIAAVLIDAWKAKKLPEFAVYAVSKEGMTVDEWIAYVDEHPEYAPIFRDWYKAYLKPYMRTDGIFKKKVEVPSDVLLTARCVRILMTYAPRCSKLETYLANTNFDWFTREVDEYYESIAYPKTYTIIVDGYETGDYWFRDEFEQDYSILSQQIFDFAM